MAEDEARPAVKRPPGLDTVLETGNGTKVDIVAVPAIGADPKKTWTAKNSREPWLITQSNEMLQKTRVMFFDHGTPAKDESLDSLAKKFLGLLRKRRNRDGMRRPVIFVCHSTGGLVAKAALVLDSGAEKPMIWPSCFGIAFMSTPHQGSSYLYASEFTKSVSDLMGLMDQIPDSLRVQFKPGNSYLWNLSREFRSISEDMKIWTFLETAASTLRTTEATGRIETDVPITSFRSGVLKLDHEHEIPLATDHMGTACFEEQDKTRKEKDKTRKEMDENTKAMKRFMEALKSVSNQAVELSGLPYNHLDVENQVEVQVNGFFEDTARGVSDETPLKPWSTTVTLADYLTKGPVACLNERIKRVPSSVDDSSHNSRDTELLSSNQPLDREVSRGASNPPRGRQKDRNEDGRSTTPPLRRSHSSVRPAVPRIHVTEPMMQGPSPTREMYPDQIRRHSINLPGDEFYQLSQRSMTTAAPGYERYLRLPHSSGDQLDDDLTEMPRTTPTFDRPDPGTEKLIWIHVPYNHTGWVPSILSKAFVDIWGEDLSDQLINGDNWYLHILKARHLQPHARFVKPGCFHFRENSSGPPSPSPGPAHTSQLALYLPYLHWDTYQNLVHRRDLIKRRLRQGRTNPVPEDIATGTSLEDKVIWRYLSCEPPIHVRRTLDQFGYPHLRSTVSKDDDQMLWKRTNIWKNQKDNGWITDGYELPPTSNTPVSIMDGKVLMVDQIWLWVLDQKTVVTFFPEQEGESSKEKLYDQSNLYNSIYNELNGDLPRRFETAGDLAALIALHAVTVLFDKTMYHDLQVLQIFEESICILTECVTDSFKRFRSQGFHSSPITSSVQRGAKDKEVAEQNKRDVCALLQLRDILDELGTILKLRTQQEAVIQVMNGYYKSRSYGKMFIEGAFQRLRDYRTLIKEMIKDAERAKQTVENLLDLKQKQANVDESRLARWQAEVTQNQSRAIMIFTIFTVIFLPLSFFTSLFGVNVREWSGTSTNLTMREMLSIAGPTSIAIIISALSLAFSKIIRDSVVKIQASVVKFTKDGIVIPIRNLFEKEKEKEKQNEQDQTEDSFLSSRANMRSRSYTMERMGNS